MLKNVFFHVVTLEFAKRKVHVMHGSEKEPSNENGQDSNKIYS